MIITKHNKHVLISYEGTIKSEIIYELLNYLNKHTNLLKALSSDNEIVTTILEDPETHDTYKIEIQQLNQEVTVFHIDKDIPITGMQQN